MNQVNETQADAIDITGIDRVELIIALWANTHALGMGRLHDRPTLDPESVRSYIAKCEQLPLHDGRIKLDYVQGRPLKVTIKGNELHHWRLYDRDAGEGVAHRVVECLRQRKVG